MEQHEKQDESREDGVTVSPDDGAGRRAGLQFGVYAGGAAGSPGGMAVGPPDHPDKVNQALDGLQANRPTLLVRGYLHFVGRETPPEGASRSPASFEAYAINGRKLDLVVCYRDPSGDMPAWTGFLENLVGRYGSLLGKVQVAEEPNLYQYPCDGEFFPQVVDAVVQGAEVVKARAGRENLDIEVGFNSVPSFDPDDRFWKRLSVEIRPSFLSALDFVGIDFFPDVFRPMPPDGSPGDLRSVIEPLLSHFRNEVLASAGIRDSIPIHVTENGWPTGPSRSPERQAEVLEIIVREIHRLKDQLNITDYEHFALRDADSSNPDIFHQFGLLRDDYTPKPAFEAYRSLIAEFG